MADNEINIVITASDQASKIIAGISKAVGGINKAVTDVTKEYIAYGDQVKQLATFTGMQADETSRLIQLADDAFVEFDTLKMAARNMADQGLAPNIKNMAMLSDQFLAIQDPAARSQFLLDNFSRAGIDMAKVMELGGQKILEMGQNVEAGLVITDEKMKSITQTKQALDAFNDSIQAMKYENAGKLLDIFTKLPKPIQDTVQVVGSLTSPNMLNNMASFFITLKGIAGLGPMITTAATALKTFAAAELAALGPALAVTAAVIAVGLAVYKLYQFFAMLFDMFKQAAAQGKFWQFLAALNPYNIAKNIIAPGRASGGPVSAGQTYTVGENGRETFVPATDGYILPHGAGSGMTMVVNYQPVMSLADRAEFETKLAPYIKNIVRGFA